jgi:hypothetical protein
MFITVHQVRYWSTIVREKRLGTDSGFFLNGSQFGRRLDMTSGDPSSASRCAEVE